MEAPPSEDSDDGKAILIPPAKEYKLERKAKCVRTCLRLVTTSHYEPEKLSLAHLAHLWEHDILVEDDRITTEMPQGSCETFHYMFHELKVQSNIIVSARYSHSGTESLTENAVYTALKAVVEEHPALGLIHVSQPSKKKKGNHTLWVARMPIVYFEKSVDFISTPLDTDAQLCEVFEMCHNQWFDTVDRSKPFWKLLVINGSYIVFVYRHSIGDGLSGYSFHQSVLNALNTAVTKASTKQPSRDLLSAPCSSQASDPDPYTQLYPKDKLSMFLLIKTAVVWLFIRFFVPSKYFLFSDAKFTRTHGRKSTPLSDSETSISRVRSLRISKENMTKSLALCRKHKTSFTALLHTLVKVTLATDIYPQASIGFCSTPVDLRPFLNVNPKVHPFRNVVNAFSLREILAPYRAADLQTTNKSKATYKKFWKLATRYKQLMDTYLHTKRGAIQGFLGGRLVGEDEEEVQEFKGLALFQHNSYWVSNLGAFDQEQSQDGNWKINDIAFSSAVTKASLGNAGLVFNVASVKGGGCLVTGVYEEGVLGENILEGTLKGVEGRLRVLLSGEGEEK